MKVKVSIFDKKLFINYLSILSGISLFFSFAFIAIELPDDTNIKIAVGGSIFLFLLIIYFVMWIRANTLKEASLKINNSTVIVKLGDIFEEDGLKVIAFNEYFDTTVDEKIISSATLNGIFLNSKVTDTSELDRSIDSDTYVNEKIVGIDYNRPYGKKKRYRLGTIFLYGDYLLSAFSRFDNNNRAYLYMNDFVSFLLNFWNEIDIIYAGRSVSIPLLGSGITRFKEYNTITEQELLELLIWSFKLSRIKFTYPSKVSIVIQAAKKDKINFYKLKEDNK